MRRTFVVTRGDLKPATEEVRELYLSSRQGSPLRRCWNRIGVLVSGHITIRLGV